MKCILMNKNTPVMRVELDGRINAITDIYEVYDINYAPLAIYNDNRYKSKNLLRSLNDWFKGRGIPSWRKDLERLLQRLDVKSPEELLNKAYALSLSDQYWLKEEGSVLEWDAINFFTNDFEYEAYLEASLDTSSTLATTKKMLYSPNNTTDGMLQKGWIIQDGKRILVKGTYTNSKEEPINEWLASRIAERLGFDYCDYSVSYSETTGITSRCENFLNEDEEIISALDVFFSERKPNSMNDFDFYVQVLEKHNVPDVRRNVTGMVVLDYLMMNVDRHMKNFGVIRNVDTLEWVRTTPIFDSGQSMQCNELTENLNFHRGICKFFTNGKKDFDKMLDTVGDELMDIPVEDLDGISDEYFEMLKAYQNVLNMSDERLSKLVDGLEIRISKLTDKIDDLKNDYLVSTNINKKRNLTI